MYTIGQSCIVQLTTAENAKLEHGQQMAVQLLIFCIDDNWYSQSLKELLAC